MRLKSPKTLHQSRQLLLVTAEDWHSTTGALKKYERTNKDNRWEQSGSTISVTLGRTGMIWGDGLIEFDEALEKKKEGDGKTPVGIFTLSSAYGYASSEEADFIKLPYVQAHNHLKCVDDPESVFYNEIVDERKVRKDWKSAEDMLREDHLYKWGIVVDYNRGLVKPGKGSCIFVHLWRTPDTPTAGCTAMNEGALKSILEWLDPDKHPIIAQFPANIYKKVQKEFQLPFI